MFYKYLVDAGDFSTAINSLYNNLENYFGTSQKEYLYTKKHLGISYMYFFTNIHTLENAKDWIDIYNQNQLIKNIDNNTNTLEKVDKSLEIIIDTYRKDMNYLPHVYEINREKEYLNIFSLLEKKHARIEINEDLIKELNSTSMYKIHKILFKYENKKNIHKDIKYLIKKHNFETIDLKTELLPLLL
jgi:hypothetical protein